MHGLHVTVGVLVLIGVLIRAFMGHFSSRSHFGVEGTVLYWHFVDVVWLALYSPCTCSDRGWSSNAILSCSSFRPTRCCCCRCSGSGWRTSSATAVSRACGTPSPSYRTRAGLFAVGYTALVIALISPLHAVGEQYFSVHMVQHLLLTLVAAPLLLLSSSMPVLLWAFHERDRATVGRLVGQPGPIRSALRWLTHPVVAWTLFVVYAVAVAPAARLPVGTRKPLGALLRAHQLFRDRRCCSGGR